MLYPLHCDWLLLSTDLKGYSRLRRSCKPINVPKSQKAVLLALDVMFALIILHVSRTNHKVSDNCSQGEIETGVGEFEFHYVGMLVLLKTFSSHGGFDVPVGRC